MPTPKDARDLLLRLCDALSKGDNDGISRLFSQSDQVLVIGSDPKEWLQGHRAAADTLALQMKEMGGSIPLKPDEPQGSGGTEMGWAADRPVLALPDGTHMQTRVSVVGQREAEGWKILHLHFSLGVGNEDSLGQDLSVANTRSA